MEGPVTTWRVQRLVLHTDFLVWERWPDQGQGNLDQRIYRLAQEIDAERNPSLPPNVRKPRWP